jgi:hypothetical protein
MDRRAFLAVYRVAFATLTIVAIVTVAADAIARGVFVPLNFFSYFTIQSNLIAIAVFLLGAAWMRREPTAGWELMRGGAVVYMTVTLVVFALLLSGVNVDTQIPWVDTVVHRVMPIAVIADWLIDPPRHRIPFRSSLVWLVYPLAWTAYTLIRGPLAGWYPYPFLDPANGGYTSVAMYVVAIFGFGTLLCALIAWVGNTLGARRVGDAARRGLA